MAASGKRRGEECVRDLLCVRDGGLRPAEAEHVRVVVFAGLRGFRGVGYQGGLDAGVTVRRHADADATGADEDAGFRAAGQNGLRHGVGVVGIVHRVLRVRAQVSDFITLLLEMARERILQFITAMVGTERDAFDGRGCGGFGGAGLGVHGAVGGRGLFEGLVDVGEHAGEQFAQGIAHIFIRTPARAEGIAHVAAAQ